MSDHSAIEWTDATWNPLRGCSRVSSGCQHCYAERVAARFSGPGLPYEGLIHPVTKGWNGKVRFIPEVLDQPLRWRKPRRIFVNSMSDLFHESVPDEWIDQIFEVMERCNDTSWNPGTRRWTFRGTHTFQILTKRPERMLAYVTERLAKKKAHAERFKLCPTEAMQNSPAAKWAQQDAMHIRSHIWCGVSVENQATADERIPLLLQCPAGVRWLSCEPLLGPLNLKNHLQSRYAPGADGIFSDRTGINGRLHWVVTGGESGLGARPMHPDWARSLRDQCASARVPFFFKQWGEFAPYKIYDFAPGDPYPMQKATVFHPPGVKPADMIKIGKKGAGRLLDGVEHNAYPLVQP
ncbi:hypothetical protein B0E46_15620 [Rhodanobacter sp. B04]|uniref:DUF5131 family protein n=1 Tax=Rhodanobacter sp. B04 TaxID=1945860 RepID=UPI000986CF41|nr:phage Gp37/Gp68 family protein [Rhodanobacter sp. B04]OOG61406.1 hypothetical protein B0E46_15620 [Rhodanobacter sp. B04]